MAEETIKVTIDGQEFEVENNRPLIDVINEKGFGVPSFCYYADLELQASCRMCLVRIEKMPKLQASCTIACRDGMEVTTQSEEIEKAQRAMGEFLLANHPLDCPVCDRGGECELQEVIFDWGDVEERFNESKNAHPEKFLSPIVANDQQRCILCKRCTRVCHEWMGEDAIEAGNRGVNTVIGTYGGWLNCSQCGNCIEVCPTGTLLDGVYRHETRPWELDQTITTCTYCSDGCQLSVGSRGEEVHRIVARDRYVNGINGEFLCIKGRFAHEFINHGERIKTPLIRYQKGGKLIPATWDDAVAFAAGKFKEAKNPGVVASSRLTNESVHTLKRFADECLENASYSVSDTYDLGPFFANLSAPLSTHKDIRFADTIVVFGGDVDEEHPLTAKQIRQAVRNGGAKLILVNDTPSRLSHQASQFIHVNPGTVEAFVAALADPGLAGTAAAKMGVNASEIDRARETANEAKGDLILMFGGDLGPEAQSIAASLASRHEHQNVKLHPLAGYSNSVGASDMMAGRRNIREVLRDCDALLIGGSLLDEEMASADLASKSFVAVQELFLTETCEAADVVFPAASFAESDGTYTNNDGFVQRVRRAIDPVHQAKPDWMITSLLASQLGVDFGYSFSASAVFRSIADSVEAYQGLRYPDLKDETRPVQVKHRLSSGGDLSREMGALRDRISQFPDEAEKITEEPRIGHKLHRVTTLTGKTSQFHLLENGNPKPDNLLVSPLFQFNLDGTPKEEEKEEETSAATT
ncbi:MAG: 4Fe-4S dicluster domain-containing protein [Acidobacteria bacterium]|nr:MAG: 4Fe-4S dicluster domain-containing protein [Acidobacteriota bacterium]REK01970.1 MAG: 4Fe-4S dicluster domain-containing protein [Acidobacteriota bacterium]REK14927.1 MAG: 4Fe-4S dicluster domain-containing protein [Acidobacteriota bacterium]REK45641.1 MAG: 4Fe-4S dicluster domain-containing protein [Acidobacteriota bacterium]